MRITDIFLAFPRLILALAFVAALGPGIENAIIAIALTSWPPYARLARAETLTIRNAEHIDAIRLQGAGSGRIIWGHVVPLCLSSVIIRVTLDMAGIILTAAGLGFLGLGAQPPQPEWGAMISGGRRFIIDYWWVATMPGIAIFTSRSASTCLATACATCSTRRPKNETSPPPLLTSRTCVSPSPRDRDRSRWCAASVSAWAVSGWASSARAARASHRPAAPFSA
jgi:ABC-type dipeptide/oligopeptide/nickel transport system permease subunit